MKKNILLFSESILNTLLSLVKGGILHVRKSNNMMLKNYAYYNYIWTLYNGSKNESKNESRYGPPGRCLILLEGLTM